MSGSQLGLGAELVPPWTVIPGGRAIAQTQSLGGAKLGERLWLAQRELPPFFAALRDAYGQPSHIGIEKPHAFNLSRIPVRQYELQGVILAALWGTSWVGEGAEVELVPAWKKTALGGGRGNATPAEYVAWATQTFDWAPSRTRPDDEAAALGVATHVALTVASGGGVLGGGRLRAPVWGIDPQLPRVSVGVLIPVGR